MKIPAAGRTTVFVLASLLFAASAACAQTGDWQTVEALKPSTIVSVKTRNRYLCTVDHVTPDALVCQPHGSRIVLIPMPASFPRADIREIRLEHNQSKDAQIGAGAGAVTGASLGAASNSASKIAGGFFGGLGGGVAGALIGATVTIVHHKRVIYKR